jgi:hypothetical protein
MNVQAQMLGVTAGSLSIKTTSIAAKDVFKPISEKQRWHLCKPCKKI